MIELGKVQTLSVLRIKDFGVYVGAEGETEGILLPKKQVPEGTKTGDTIEVFIYRDSSDRLIATTTKPAMQIGEMEVLTVKERARIGAFLDWGLEKDLFLPYKEQTAPIRQGDKLLVALYKDKSDRLCATMRISDRLRSDSDYQVGDQVTGTIYRINPEMGVFVAVDNRFYGMVSKDQLFKRFHAGEIITAWVSAVREDGKLNLRLREEAYLAIQEDADVIMAALDAEGGVLMVGDKTSPDIIKKQFKMSKNSFKRALGRLLKEGKIEVSDTQIKKK